MYDMAKKLILDCDESTWNEVLKFKIDRHLDNLNDAVVLLIRQGLKK